VAEAVEQIQGFERENSSLHSHALPGALVPLQSRIPKPFPKDVPKAVGTMIDPQESGFTLTTDDQNLVENDDS